MSAFTTELEERGLLEAAKAICAPLHLRVDELRARSVAKAYVTARQQMAKLLHGKGWSTTMIGELLDRDSTSVLSMLKGGKGKAAQ